jgi:hypothetical protein
MADWPSTRFFTFFKDYGWRQMGEEGNLLANNKDYGFSLQSSNFRFFDFFPDT